jgi:hypothetical protein
MRALGISSVVAAIGLIAFFVYAQYPHFPCSDYSPDTVASWRRAPEAFGQVGSEPNQAPNPISSMNWPNDADGDVMRRLQSSGFSFDREAEIDFNIDFDQWPPDPSLIGILQNELPSAKVSVHEDYTSAAHSSVCDQDAGRPHTDQCCIRRKMRELGVLELAQSAARGSIWHVADVAACELYSGAKVGLSFALDQGEQVAALVPLEVVPQTDLQAVDQNCDRPLCVSRPQSKYEHH